MDGHGANGVLVLRENWPVVELFLALGTQWRIGPFGPTGLDYPAVEALMNIHQIAKKHRARRFTGLRVMEAAALDEMSRRLSEVRRK